MEFQTKADSLEVWLLPCFKDNYIFLIYDRVLQHCTVVDPGDSEVVLKFLNQYSMVLNEIWITHHHADHIGGVKELLEKFNPVVRGSQLILGRLPDVNQAVDHNSEWKLGDFKVSVLELPGHTKDHIAYWIHNENHSLLFSGDVLFGLGCGRIFEGSYEEMHSSLKKIAAMPPSTQIFCSHEYTENNLRFSLQMEPELEALQIRKLQIQELRGRGQPTVPLTLSEELKSNLFLRALREVNSLESFRALRESRNQF